MKSLSILVFLGTLSALIFGAIFAIKPVSAQAAAPSHSTASQAEAVLAPVTGAEAPQKAGPAAADPGAVLAQAFVINLQKDRSAPAVDTAPMAAVESAAAPAPAQATTLQSFAGSVSNGNAGQVTGIYVEGVMAYGVTNQGGNVAFVSEQPNVVTQFGLAAQYGSQGFLAHNYLAGGVFAQISNGQVITLVYGDGSSRDFQVTGTQRYQALSPDSTQSAFVDLNSGDQLSASSLFHKVYNQDNALVLQTCIERDGISTWGRLFITAVPLS